MYDYYHFKELESKYGHYASWAIWNEFNENDSLIINKLFQELNNNYVLIGLNVSKDIEIKPFWSNFRSGKHDRKLKYACNDTSLRGSYMTDLFKEIVEKNSFKLKRIDTMIIRKNVDFFIEEMKDIKINNDTRFVIFGQLAFYYYKEYFMKFFFNTCINYTHYSDFSKTDKEWVLGLWKTLGIIADYNEVIKKYKKSKIKI